MNVVERLKGILLSPRTEWPKIAAEPMSAQQIYTSWVMILAAIGPLAIIAGTGSIAFAIASYVVMLVMTALIAFVVDALAPRFGGTKDFVSALKLSAFSYTAAYVAGIFNVLGASGGILVLVASIYAWYTFYLGAPVLRKCSVDKAAVFTIIVVAIGFVLGMVFGTLASMGSMPAGVAG